MNCRDDISDAADAFRNCAEELVQLLTEVIGCETVHDPVIRNSVMVRRDLLNKQIRAFGGVRLRQVDTFGELKLEGTRRQLEEHVSCLRSNGDRAHALYRFPELARSLRRARRSASKLAKAFRRLEKVTNDSRAAQNRASAEAKSRLTIPASPRPARPMFAASGLVDIAVLVLPGDDRGRYKEEFGGELLDLAIAGTSRLQQFIYALRILGNCWQVRSEVRGSGTQKVRW